MSDEVSKAAMDKKQDIKKKNPYGEYLNLKIAKSQHAKHSPDIDMTGIAAPLHHGALTHPAIFLFAWPLSFLILLRNH